MEGVVDRIEGKIAVIELEGEFMAEIPKKFLPKNVADGDVLDIVITINPSAKEKRINKIKELQRKLKNRK